MKKFVLFFLFFGIFSGLFGQTDNKNRQKETNDNNNVNTKISAGASGVKRSISYRFSSSVSDEDPGIGKFTLDRTNISQVKYLITDNIDLSGEDQSQWFSTWDDSTGATGRGQIIIVDPETDKTTILDVTDVFTRKNGYWKIPVNHVSGQMPANDRVYYYIFNRIASKKNNQLPETAQQVPAPEIAVVSQPETPVQPTAPVTAEATTPVVIQVSEPLVVGESTTLVSDGSPNVVADESSVMASDESITVVREESAPVVSVETKPAVTGEAAPVINVPTPPVVADTAPVVAVASEPRTPEVQQVQPSVPAVKQEPEITPAVVSAPQPEVQPASQPQVIQQEVVAVQAPVEEKKDEQVMVAQKEEPPVKPLPATESGQPAVPAERLPVREDKRRPADKSSIENQNAEERLTQVSTVRQPVRQPSSQTSVQSGSQPAPVQPSTTTTRQSSGQPEPVNRQATTSSGTIVKETNQAASTDAQPVAQTSQGSIRSQVTSTGDQRNNSSPPPSYQPNLPVYQSSVSPYASGRGHGKWYSGIIEAGYGLGISDYGIQNFRLNFINGFHIGPTFTIGLGLGLRKYYPGSYSDRTLYSKSARMPVFLDLRKRFSTRTVTPYMAFGIGNTMSFVTDQDSTRTVNDGLMINASGGIWLNISQRFGIFAGVGYESEKFEYVWISDDSHFKKNGGSVSLNIGISF